MNDQSKDIAALYQQHKSKMLRLATLILRDEMAAEDVVGEVFLNLMDSATTTHNVEGFLLTAVRNRCINTLKSKNARRTVAIDGIDAPAENTQDEKELRMQGIEHFIDEQLTPQTRRVLWLRFKEKKKYAEIAKELSISEAAVYKHLAQGLQRLRQEFNK